MSPRANLKEVPMIASTSRLPVPGVPYHSPFDPESARIRQVLFGESDVFDAKVEAAAIRAQAEVLAASLEALDEVASRNPTPSQFGLAATVALKADCLLRARLDILHAAIAERVTQCRPDGE